MPQNPTLTEIAIRSAKPPAAGTTTVWDGSTQNFGIRISSGGTKSFIVLLGSGSRKSLGRYPDVSLAEARSQAKMLLARRRTSIAEPALVKHPFNEALTEFLEQSARDNRPRTTSEYARILKRHFDYGKLPLSEIEAPDILKRLKTLKTAPSQQRHAFVAFKVFMTWCVRHRYLNASPCEHLQAPSKPVKRERVLTDEELAKILGQAQATSHPFGQIVLLLLLTGQRRMEIGNMQWEWINEKDMTITIPSGSTKNKQVHQFPYTERVVTILSTIPRTKSYLFPAARDRVTGKPATTFNGWSKSKAAFDKACPLPAWTLHDLRRTFSTGLASLGVRIEVTEKLLNHISGGSMSDVARIYNRYSYAAEMREAVQKWDAYITKLPQS